MVHIGPRVCRSRRRWFWLGLRLLAELVLGVVMGALGAVWCFRAIPLGYPCCAQVRIIDTNSNRFSTGYIQAIRIAMGKSIDSQSSQAKGQNNLFQVHAECRTRKQRLMGLDNNNNN